MTTAAVDPKVKALAKDLSKEPPRSPRETLGGYVIAARAVDKCRAVLAESAGEYHSGCPLDNMWLDFAGIRYETFKAKVAEGLDDEALGDWIKANAKQQERIEVVRWNNQLRDAQLSGLPDKLQLYMEDYIPQYVPKGKIVYRLFDVYDYEEGHL
jgi:hypothetical protein